MYTFRYDAIVFDFDGTLVQSNKVKTWAFGKLYEKYGESIVPQVTAYQEEHGGISRFVKFRHIHEHLLGLPYTDQVEKELSNKYSELVFDAVVQASYVEGALEFPEKHHQHLPLFVASGTPEVELREIITSRGMNRLFRDIYGSPKTKTEILRLILSNHNWAPERVLMVGDSLVDLEGAQNAKTDFIGVELSDNFSVLPQRQCISNFNHFEKFL